MTPALTAALDALEVNVRRDERSDCSHPKTAEARLEVERLIGEIERERDSFRQQCVVQAERDRLRAFLTDERDKLMMAHRGTTHWDGCEKSHRDCARIKALDSALSASDSSEREKGI
jgi:hypothetical protein